MLVEPEQPDSYHEPTSVSITRLVCQTTVVMTVLVGSGALLIVRPEYSSVAVAFIGVCIGACFGLVRLDGLRRRRP
jgi:hypothetical protein